MNYATLSRQLHHKVGQVLEATLADDDCLQALSKSYKFVSDLSNCIQVINEKREKDVLELGQKEYEFALSALGQGYYRHAFAALRLSFELCLSAIEFSANELSLRRWEKDLCDVNWSRIINPDTGLFSTNFIRAFHDGAEERRMHYRALAEQVYRECSEYVHGNSFTYNNLPKELEFSKESVLSWCDKASTVYMIFLYCFFVRYLADMEESKRKILETPFMETLGHIEIVRLTFGGAT